MCFSSKEYAYSSYLAKRQEGAPTLRCTPAKTQGGDVPHVLNLPPPPAQSYVAQMKVSWTVKFLTTNLN